MSPAPDGGARRVGDVADVTRATVPRETRRRSVLKRQPLLADDPKVRRPDITVARPVRGWEPEIGLAGGHGRTVPYFNDLAERGLAEARTH